jgi:hypothetical protein
VPAEEVDNDVGVALRVVQNNPEKVFNKIRCLLTTHIAISKRLVVGVFSQESLSGGLVSLQLEKVRIVKRLTMQSQLFIFFDSSIPDLVY